MISIEKTPFPEDNHNPTNICEFFVWLHFSLFFSLVYVLPASLHASIVSSRSVYNSVALPSTSLVKSGYRAQYATTTLLVNTISYSVERMKKIEEY
jgi:hypothetical protein